MARARYRRTMDDDHDHDQEDDALVEAPLGGQAEAPGQRHWNLSPLCDSEEMDSDRHSSQEYLVPRKLLMAFFIAKVESFAVKKTREAEQNVGKRRGIKRRNLCRKVLICLVLQLCLVAVLVAVGIALGYVIFHSAGTSAGGPQVAFPGYQPSPYQDEICAQNPVMQVSLDGYWSGYLARNQSYFLHSLASSGVRAEYMRSQYPTKTFPNHFSIVTGLFPEFHGIVDNTFYDKQLQEKFTIRNTDELDPKWWLGEPVWITAEKQGVTAGIYFWPGSAVEIEGRRPHYYYKYNDSEPFINRVRTVLSWFDLPKDKRPQYIATYFNQPDHSGHAFGPDSKEVNATLEEVDYYLGLLVVGLQQKGILDCVNLIITSDHGMAEVLPNQHIMLNTSALPDGVEALVLGVSASLDVFPPANKTEVYEMFKYPNGSTFHPAVEVYYREEAPPRFHIGHSTKWRYGDIVMAPKVGWLLTSTNWSIAGEHGYDNNAEQMRAIFVAHGPAFQSGVVVPAFDNIEIYNLVCALLGVTPSVNNGTFGSLYSMLRPEVASKLPPARTHVPLPEHDTVCPFPSDDALFLQRANLTCHDADCSINYDSRIAAARSLNISDEEVQAFQHYHLPWGVPAGGGGDGSLGACLLTGEHFVIKYNAELRIPIWAAYRLDGQTSSTADPETELCFSHDPRVDLSFSSNCSDYTNTVFAKGQMVPASHMQSNATAKELTYLLSNAAPQYEVYTRGVGSNLDAKVQEWANKYSTVYVLSGVVLDANDDGQRDMDSDYSRWTRGRGTTAVPSHFFRVVTYCSDQGTTNVSSCPVGHLQSVAFLTVNSPEPVPEERVEAYIQERMTTVREVETITGISFFPSLSTAEQNTLALRIVTSLADV